ncbi:hypothetical protein [Microbacterium sp.]
MADKQKLHAMIDELAESLGARKRHGIQVPVPSDRRLIELLEQIVEELPD